MYKVIIWGIGYLYNKYINCVRFISRTASKSVEKEFDSMPYARKIMFVPYDSILMSSVRLTYTDMERSSGITIGMKSNGIANGHIPLFDILFFKNGEDDFLCVREV